MTEMTKAERIDLAKLVRMRAKVARTEVDQRAAELRADAEEQLAAIYRADDPVWAEITQAAKTAVAEADEQIELLCRERGIDPEFRPSLNVSWYGRGANALASRRAELRKVAEGRVDAASKGAKHQIEAESVRVQTELLAAGLTTAAAGAFLVAMPTAEQLMPRLDVRELGGAL